MTTVLLALAVRSSVVLAAGLLLAGALTRRSAALRHRVLSATLLAAALVTPLGMLLPEWKVTLPVSVTDAAPPVAAASPVAPASVVAVVPQTAPADPWPLLAIAWLAGTLAFAGVLVVGLASVSRLASRASPVEEREWLDVLHGVAARHGLTRRIILARTDSPTLLATWGVIRPHVLLPRHATDWTLDRLRIVLAHELAHVRRHDWVIQVAAETLRAVLWFNPLVWIACTRLRRESEQACDDEVLTMGVAGRDYAAQLLDLARRCRTTGRGWAPAMSMAHPSTLERRITAMLNPRLDRRAPSRRTLAALGALLLIVTLPAAALRARQAGPAPLTGTLYDMSGGVLPGVEVTLVDAAKTRTSRTTDAEGHFEFAPVASGKYLLEAALPGFRLLRQEIELNDARDWTRVITMQLGELRETITVRDSRAAVAPSTVKSATVPTRVGGNVRPPKKLKDVKPIYPPAMREAGLTGNVQLEAVIARDGSVSSVRVVNASVHPDFAIAAADAVRQWKFSPTLLNGEAVEVVMTVSIRFDLEN